jgi:putative membrane protein
MNYAQGEIRDRLANERTLLAWIRTALAFIALGLGLAKLALFMEAAAHGNAPLSHMPDPNVSFFVGAVLVAMGGVISIVGAWRSYIWNRAIDPTGKPPENLSLGIIAALTALMSAGLLVYLLAS